MGALPERRTQSLRQGEHNDFFKSTFEESRGIATKRTASYEVIMLRPTHGSKEVTPSSNKEAPSDITAHCA
jgi:hypothetical protein